MARIDPPALDDLSSEQKALRDLIMRQRSTGEARGPFGVLLHAPDLGSRVADFVNYLLSDTRLSHRLKELAIITVATVMIANSFRRCESLVSESK